MLLGGAISTPPASLRVRSTLNPQNANAVASQAAFPLASYSITDEDLESRGFRLRRTPEGLNLDQLNSVFVAVGFPRRDTAKIKVALEHTDALLWLEYEKTRKPVAFARATGDGVFNAIIWDVVVDPSFQSLGLGKAVMERLIVDLQRKGICNIALYSEPRVLGFYRPLGFVSDPDGIKGMVFIQEALAWWKKATEQRMEEMRAKNPNPIISEIPATIRSIVVWKLINILFFSLDSGDKFYNLRKEKKKKKVKVLLLTRL